MARQLSLYTYQYTCEYIKNTCKNEQVCLGRRAWGSFTMSLCTCIYTYKKESKKPAWGGLPRPHHILYMCIHVYGCLGQPQCLSKYVQTYIRNGKTYACLGRPAWGDLDMPLCTLGAYITRGRPGKPQYVSIRAYTYLYTCGDINNTCKNQQYAWGGVPGAALPCPYVNEYLHTKWESKKPAWGGLPRHHHLSIHVHTCI